MNQAYLDAIHQLTDERKLLSAVEKLLKNGLTGLSKRAETTLALRSTQLSFMWLGRAKGALGSENPYPNSTDPSSKAIEPSQDTAENVTVDPEYLKDETAFIKYVRHGLSTIEPMIKNDTQILTDHREYQRCIEESLIHCVNAKMWLGQVLGSIKAESENPVKSAAKIPLVTEKPKKDKKGVFETIADKLAGTKTGKKNGKGTDSAKNAGK